MRQLIFFILISGFSALNAQGIKQEYEQKIDAQQMPAEALNYIENLKIEKQKMRYYKEIDGAATSFESKFKSKGYLYSVEFNENGKLEDVEVEISIQEIGSALKPIENYLNTTFERHRIEKIQAQYKPNNTFENTVPNNPDAWELIVATKTTANKLERFEMTFDQNGNLLRSREVVRQPYDFLLF
ncbi:hypothetical protein [Leeuwenhoekiella sp. NPDC079379]|uniref:hypothetical protein n=1 Tax=Leeuwenhoekiella sp. NPDC079379 TaxID=3364122 RepID=UPI0037C803EA